MSDKEDIATSYDISNDFFRMWLDDELNYTCAVFDEGPHGKTDNLELAQRNKLGILSEYAHITPNTRVLDIGCGWGGALRYLVDERNVREAHGITLSEAQHAEIRHRGQPKIHSSVCDYRHYKPSELFDAVISICVLEHSATPLQVRNGEHKAIYRDYFKRAHEWTRPGSYFALQTILRVSVPRNRKDIEDMAHIAYKMFPGGYAVRLSEVVEAVNPYWEIMEIKTRRHDYQLTTQNWLNRLKAHESEIRSRFGNNIYADFDRYLTACVEAFAKNYVSLAQYSLRRR